MIVGSSAAMEVVGEAGDGLEAVELVRREAPDVVLMDVRMPELDGIEATRRIASAGVEPRTRVVIVTTFELDEYVFNALEAGASAFLLKAARLADLIRAIEVVAAGDAILAPSVTRRLIETFGRRHRPAAVRPSRLASLTERELEVLGPARRADCPTPRSRRRCTSARRRSRRTSRTCWTSCTCATASRPLSWPTRPA